MLLHEDQSTPRVHHLDRDVLYDRRGERLGPIRTMSEPTQRWSCGALTDAHAGHYRHHGFIIRTGLDTRNRVSV